MRRSPRLEKARLPASIQTRKRIAVAARWKKGTSSKRDRTPGFETALIARRMTRNPVEARHAMRPKSARRSAKKSRCPEASVGAKPAAGVEPRTRAASTRTTTVRDPLVSPPSDGGLSGSDIDPSQLHTPADGRNMGSGLHLPHRGSGLHLPHWTNLPRSEARDNTDQP